MGLATGPDGSLYISDSEKGRIWKIMYHGDKKNFGQKNLEKMQDRETKTYIKTPDSILDNMDKKSSISTGAYLYKTYCGPCHQQNGFGDKNRFPSILNSACINGDKSKLIGILLNGLNQKNKFSGKSNNYIMPKFNFLKDQEIADLLTYIRTNFDNNSDAVKSDLVKIIRNKLPV